MEDSRASAIIVNSTALEDTDEWAYEAGMQWRALLSYSAA
jgi:hypothetical protein